MKLKSNIILGLFLFISACGTMSTQPVNINNPATGQEVYALYCAGCHSTQPGMNGVGPSLAGIATQASTRISGTDARGYITVSIVAPQSYLAQGYDDIMPRLFSTTLSTEQREMLIEYLLTLE